MKNEFWSYIWKCELPRNAMSEPVFPIDNEFAVTARMTESNPQPTSACFSNFRPKSFFKSLSMSATNCIGYISSYVKCFKKTIQWTLTNPKDFSYFWSRHISGNIHFTDNIFINMKFFHASMIQVTLPMCKRRPMRIKWALA